MLDRVIAPNSGRGRFSLRRLEPKDFFKLYFWTNSPSLAQSTRTFRPVMPWTHAAWFMKARSAQDRWVRGICVDGELVGVVQLLHTASDHSEFRVRIASPEYRGIGLGAWSTMQAVRHLGRTRPGTTCWLVVKQGNVPAIRTYLRAGFTFHRDALEAEHQWGSDFLRMTLKV